MDSPPSEFSIALALEQQIRDQGSRVAVWSEPENRAITFTQLGERIAAQGVVLRRAGVEEGQTAALAVGNCPEFIELYFALRSVGAAVLLLDEPVIAPKMGASWVLTKGADGIRCTRVTPAVSVPEGTALIKLTSGSTLAPRGACFTEEALVEGVDHILRGMEITSADRVLVSIPLSHGYGFDNGVLSLAAGGTPLILQPDVLPGALLRTIRDREVTFFPAVPTLIRALGMVAWPATPSLRRVISASAPLSKEAADAFTRASGLPVHQFLGSTETGGISFETQPGNPAAEGCVGFPLPGVRLELIDGEILSVHSKANRFALLPQQPLRADVETGDRGVLTPEGRLKLLGRATLTANIGGLKVDLGALDAFFRGLPGVDEAAAIPLEDPLRGDRVVAYVETAAHTTERLMQLCREQLSVREVPSEIRVVNRLPRNARGKVDRSALVGEGADMYDVAIIGGGPAGSTAATVLARAGLKTLILEREKFPRFHIGESLLPLNQELFTSLGLNEILKEQKFVLKYGAQFVSNEGSIERAFDFFQGGLGKDTFAYEVERETFDHLLAQHAVKQGAELREETNVLEATTSAEGPCRLRVRTAGVESTIEAKSVIDASGQSSLLAKQNDLRMKNASLQKMAVFARYKGGVRREGRKEGNIDIVLGAGCWFWIIPLRDDVLSVGCVANIADWKATGLTPEQYFEKAVQSSPYVVSRLKPGVREGGFTTASNYCYTSKKFAGDGFLLAGDAAEFMDPIFSTGVILAMRSGELAGRVMAEAIRSGKARTEASFQSYEKAFRTWTRNHFAMIDAFYGPGFGNVFLTPKNTLGMVKAVIALLAGKSEPTWLDRMRLKLFYWLIRTNNKYRMIPDPRPAESAVPHG